MAAQQTASVYDLDYTTMGIQKVVYSVRTTRPEHDNLPPIALGTSSPGFSFQDYLTADEADRLADALMRAAARSRSEAA